MRKNTSEKTDQDGNAGAGVQSGASVERNASYGLSPFYTLCVAAFNLYVLNVVFPFLLRHQLFSDLWAHTLKAMPDTAGSALGAAILSALFGASFLIASMAYLRPKKDRPGPKPVNPVDSGWLLMFVLALFAFWLLSYLTLHALSGPYESLDAAHRFSIRTLCFPIAWITAVVSGAAIRAPK